MKSGKYSKGADQGKQPPDDSESNADIAELAGHPPGCRRCGVRRKVATRVSAHRVLHQVARWRESIAIANVHGVKNAF